MKILMTQRTLADFGGSELFTIEVARELANRGHQVVIYTKIIGDIAKLVYSKGVGVVTRLSEVPWKPDVIHGQHHLPLIAALSYFKDVQAIYFCHGIKPWAERPPAHPRIRYYFLMCEWMRMRCIKEHRLPEDKVKVLGNFVNTKRFSEIKSVPDKPKKALLFGQAIPLAEQEALKQVCKKFEITLDLIGYAYGNPQARPEAFLQRYDLVFAIGRSAFEAIGSGCAVIPIIPALAGDLVTTENLKDCLHSNFSPIYYTSGQKIDESWFARQLESYSPTDVKAVTEMIRSECTLTRSLDILESNYQELASGPVVESKHDDIVPYFEALWPEIDTFWRDAVRAGHEVRKAEQKIVKLEQRVEQLTQRAERAEQKAEQAQQKQSAMGLKGEQSLQKALQSIQAFKKEQFENLKLQVAKYKTQYQEQKELAQLGKKNWKMALEVLQGSFLGRRYAKKIRQKEKKPTYVSEKK